MRRLVCKRPLLLFTALCGIFACQAKRDGSVVYEMTKDQKKNGVVREIQCATAHSVYAWDVEEVGVSSDPIGPPLEASAKMRYLTPLTEENYFEVCDEAAEKSAEMAEKKIKVIGGDKESHTIKEESVFPTETETQADVRWVKDNRYSKYLREGTCRCKDKKVENLKRSIYCTQEYSFELESSEDQKCYGYFTKAVPNVKGNELIATTKREYCTKNTVDWLKECQKNQEVYNKSTFFLAKGYKPLDCQIAYENFTHPCECSTDVLNLVPVQGARFYCTRTFNDQEVILDINTTGGN